MSSYLDQNIVNPEYSAFLDQAPILGNYEDELLYQEIRTPYNRIPNIYGDYTIRDPIGYSVAAGITGGNRSRLTLATPATPATPDVPC